MLAALGDATLDTAAKVAKIKEILLAHEKLAASFGRDGDDAEAETFVAKKSSPSVESIALALRLGRGQLQSPSGGGPHRPTDLKGFARLLRG